MTPHLQEMILEDMRDPSMMMEFYARYCRDDPGLCARYAEHLRWSEITGGLGGGMQKGASSFPDVPGRRRRASRRGA